MNWITIVWSMMAGAVVCLAGFHLALYLRHGRRPEYLAFAAMAVALVFASWFELSMMHARSVAEFIVAQRWCHMPIAGLVVSIALYVRCRFGTGRLWMLSVICVLRIVLLVVNFLSPVTVNYSAVHELRFLEIFDGEFIAVPVADTNPWTRLAALSLVLLVWYVVDATFTAARGRERAVRQRAFVVGGGLLLAIVTASISATLVHEGWARVPYIITPAFMLILLGLAYELATDVLKAKELALELLASERRRHQAEERMHLATSAAAVGFWEWRASDDSVWLSDEARHLVDLRQGEIATLSDFHERVHQDDREGLRRLLQRSAARCLDCEGEFRVIGDDGSVRWIGARGRMQPSEERGAPVMRGVMFDVTQRKRMEFELVQQRNELAHLSRVTMLGELSGSLVHELNQPLAAILSNAQAAQRLFARHPPDLEQVGVILSDIVDDDRRAGAVISRLRSLLRKDEIRHEPLDLQEVIKDVLRIMRSDFLNRSVTIRESYEAGNSRVVGDRVLLQQVFLNLFVNACEAMENEPRARKLIEVTTVDGEDRFVETRIADHGKGIPEEELEHIFQPFVSTKSRGMGLGLSVCQTIVTVHGGKLWATSTPEKGATMHLILPVNSGGIA